MRPDPTSLKMRVALNASQTDARRGVVRLNPLLLDALGVAAWDALELRGKKATGALAAAAPPGVDQATILMDDITCMNAGVVAGDVVDVSKGTVSFAASVTLTGLPQGAIQLDPAAVRFALLGKVLFPGDKVSLLPQDFSRPGASETMMEVDQLVQHLHSAWGEGWKTALLDVAATAPPGLVRVTMETVFNWDNAAEATTAGSGTPVSAGRAVPALEDLPGLEDQIKRLKEVLEIGFHHTELLGRLGTQAQMGVLITGPPGSGKVALVEAVAAAVGAKVHRLWGPALARGGTDKAASDLVTEVAQAEAVAPAVLLIEDVEALAPREDPGPLLSVLLEVIAGLIGRRRIAVVCTTAHPEGTNTDLRSPGILDLEIEIPLPRREDRRRILEVHSRGLPLGADVSLDAAAAKTPGFVAADLLQLCREAALHAAVRAKETGATAPELLVMQADLDAALEVVRPSSMAGASIEIADVKLDDVGDMEETKKVLVESMVWPLRYPDSFARLGVEPPRGVLLFGPPGCGKTYLVKALASEAEANFLSVKGAELLSKWVGESERAVRELFRRARNAAPAVVFFDEIDALAPVRGQSSDSGTTDRVVAQILTELDGVEDLSGVFVLGATNRPDLIDPALLRPGRLERLVYVPPPDAIARGLILKAVTRKMPCSPEFDPTGTGAACEGYSAADLEALARAAAMIAMREDMSAPQITDAHFKQAASEMRPSLRADQVEHLKSWADQMTRS